MRGKNLFDQRGARAKHSDDKYRTLRFEGVRPRPAHPTCIVGADDQIDDFCQLLTIVRYPPQLCELICTAEIDECLLEIPDIIEVFADRIAQADFLPRQ